MKTSQKRVLIRIILSIVTLIIVSFLPVDGYVRLVCFLVPYFIIGYDILWKAIRNIAHGQVFDENFLMSVATIGAFILGEYLEGSAVMLFYQVGELFQSIAVGKSRKSISSLMNIRPDYANLEKDGEVKTVSPEDVEVNDIIIIKPGEKIPLDGVIVEGTVSIDTAAITGESAPRSVDIGENVTSGCISIDAVIKVRVTKLFGDSTVSKILELVENSVSKKAKTENLITRFARIYTPCVVICAVILAIVPSLFTGEWGEWINRALIFLVISCPCALVISVPMSFFGGIGGASKCGILIKGGNYLEALAKTDVVVFDKTGTLTHGKFSVTEVKPFNTTEETLIELSAYAEYYSKHPVSRCICKNYSGEVDTKRISDVKEISGKGVCILLDGIRISAGNEKLMNEIGVEVPECQCVGTVVHVSADNEYKGYILVEDTIKEDSKEAISMLKKNGVRKTVMLTGDLKKVGEKTASVLEIDEVHAELLPHEKVERVENLLEEIHDNKKLVFVGDGINDAPVLSRADIGVAMGGVGSDAAIEAADIVLMDDKPYGLVTAIEISKKTLSIVYQNIVFAIGVKVLVLILGALGLANMWAAVFADVGVSVIAILNAMRALKVKPY